MEQSPGSWTKPGNTAAAAAAERRLAYGKWCLPCKTVVELLLSSSRSQFLVKETRGECDNSFFKLFSNKEFQTFFVATSKGGNGENKDARKRNMVIWIGICLDISGK